MSLCMILLLSGCNNRVATDHTSQLIRITPSILTRVSGLYFEQNDCIGLTIVRASGNYVDNCMMTYDGSGFVGEQLVWYAESEGPATFLAYYPYSSDGIDTFSVAADQRDGGASSDLLGAVKSDVVPSSSVNMVFYHLMSQLDIVVNNNTAASVTEVVVSGFIPTATVDLSVPAATVKSDAAPSDITAFEVTPGAAYRVILVPQQAPMTVTVHTDDGEVRTKSLSSAQLEGGRRYNLSVVLDEQSVDVTLSGEIGDWVDGGSLDEGENPGVTDPDPEAPSGSESALEYAGETYATTVIGGVTWMAENLRYMPDDAVLNSDVWYPAAGESQVGELGLLYSYSVAMNGSSYTSGVPVQGICPSGWHIPTRAELETLNTSVSVDFIPDSGLYGETGYMDASISGLLSCELDSGNTSCYVLRKKNNDWSITTLPVTYGFSLRCVKD